MQNVLLCTLENNNKHKNIPYVRTLCCIVVVKNLSEDQLIVIFDWAVGMLASRIRETWSKDSSLDFSFLLHTP